MKINTKVNIIILIFVMVIGGFFVPSKAASYPVFNSVYFSSSTATFGDLVTIYASYSTTSTMSYGYAELLLPDGSYYSWIYLNYNSNTGNLEGSFSVNQYTPTSLYIGEVYGFDINGYATYNYNGTSFTNIGITISGTTPDITAPSLVSVSFDRGTANAGDIVNVYLSVTDDVSGIQYAEIDIYDSQGYVTNFFANNNSNSLSQTLTFQITINKYWASVIYIGAIYLTDYAGNSNSFYNNTDYTAPLLSLVRTTYDSQAPVLNYIQFSQSTAVPGDNVTITINASDDASGTKEVYLMLSYGQASNYLSLSLYNTSNALTQSFVGSIVISQYAPQQLYVQYVQLFDYAGRGSYYSNATDYTSPILQISGSTPDFTPPAFQSVWFDTNFATWGSIVHVYVLASDNISGINSIYVDLTDINNNYYYSSLYLNFNTQTGSWEASIPIYSYFPGQVIVSSVKLYDNANNYYQANNGSDFISPVLNTGPLAPNTIGVSISPNYAKSYVGSTVNFEANITSNFDHYMPNTKLELSGTDGNGNNITFYSTSTTVNTWQNGIPYQLVPFTVVFNTPGQITGRITLYDDMNVAWSSPFSWTVMTLSSNNNNSNSSVSKSPSLPSLPLPTMTFNITLIAMFGLIIINRRRFKN